MKKVFFWFVAAGVLNGLLLWIRERLHDEARETYEAGQNPPTE